MEHVRMSEMSNDHWCCIGFLVFFVLLFVWMCACNRGAPPTLQENMAHWKSIRVVSGNFETFTASDTRAVMAAVSDPKITWEVFSSKFAKLKLHPATFVRLVDAAKKGNLSQVQTAYMIADDHRYH